MSGTVEIADDNTIDEEEEEALLKSDSEDDAAANNDLVNSEELQDTSARIDDDPSSDDDIDQEDQLIKEYIEILDKIDKDKYNYDNYIKLVFIAHKLNDLDKIRQSCELFSSIYPLSPDIWLQWLKIEQSIACSQAEILKVENLFRRALNDYYSFGVALEMSKLASKSPNATELWSELLAVYALHCTKSRDFFVIWNEYHNKNEPENTEKYIEECKSFLRIPHKDMEETYIEFKLFCEKHKSDIQVNWNRIDEKYHNAKDQLKRILPYEEQLIELNPKFHQDRAKIYKQYIDEAHRFIDENILQILYERMVTDCCLNAFCWLDYVEYLEKRDNKYGRPSELKDFNVFQQSPMDIVNRALRNCPWSEKLYVKKMRIAEYLNLPKSEVLAILEQALAAGFQTPEPSVALWLEYLGYLRRQTDYTEERDIDVLRANFNLAWNTLGKQWGVLADCNCEILQFWGRLEYGPLQDLAKGKELWTTVMESSDNPLKSGLWIEFAHLELKKGADAARRVYKKALAVPGIDNLYVITSAWLRFERCNGTLDQVIYCQSECERTFDFLASQTVKELKTSYKNEPQLKSKLLKRKQQDDVNDEKPINSNSSTKLKSLANTNPQKKPKIEEKQPSLPPSTHSHHEHLEVDTSKDPLRIFISNLDYNITEEEIREGLPELSIENVTLLKTATGRGRGFGYVELTTENDVSKAIPIDRRLLNGRPIFISKVVRDKEERARFKYSEDLEPRKLFVKGIPYETTKEELEELFGKYGKLKDVRIVCHKSGKSKGIAYIEYEEEGAAKKAVLKLDQYKLQDFTLNVAISAPPPKLNKQPIVNKAKSLGIGFKNPINRGEQKPRMSFIPSSVRQKVLQATQSTSASISNGVPAIEKKSNDDFRKLLTK